MKINDDLLPVIVSATEPTGEKRKKIWKQHSRNILKTVDIYTSQFGLTITKNADGSLTFNGTPSQEEFFEIGRITVEPGKYYTLTGSPSGSSNNTYFQYWDNMNLSGTIKDFGSGATISSNTLMSVPITIAIRGGQNVSGKVFYPMVTVSSEVLPYEKHIDDKEYMLNNNNQYEEFTPVKIYKSIRRSDVKINTTYVYDTEFDIYGFQINKMVFIHIGAIAFKQAVPNYTAFISGLPPAGEYLVTYLGGGVGTEGVSMRLGVTQKGSLQTHWGGPDAYGDASDKQYSGTIIYEAA